MTKHEKPGIFLAVAALALVVPHATAQSLPQITSLCPPASTIGDPALRVTITGTGFPSNPVVFWVDRSVPSNSRQLYPSANNDTTIAVDVPPALTQHDSDVYVGFSYAAESGVSIRSAPASQPVTFRVYPAPTIERLQPSETTAGVPLALAVRGSTFIPASASCPAGSQVLWNGGALRGSRVDTVTAISVDVPASLLKPGRAQVSVRNYGNGISPPVEIVVNRPPSITTVLPDGTVGRSFNVQFAGADGTLPYTWSVVPGAGDLPPGLLLGASGVLAGLPSLVGNYSFRVRLQDAAGAAVTRDYTVQVFQPDLKPAIQSACPAATTQGAQDLVLTLAVPGVFRPQVRWDGIPLDVTASNQAGVMSLTARVDPRLTGVSGRHEITVANLDTKLLAVSDAMPFLVLPRPAIASLTPDAATEGSRVRLQLTGANFVARGTNCGIGSVLEWNGQPLNDGVSVSDSGVTADIPPSLLTAGQVAITVANPGGGRSNSSIITINPPPAILSTAMPLGLTGRTYRNTVLLASGGTPPLVWSLADGTGLEIDPATGTVSGVPGAPGDFDVRVQVRDRSAVTASQTFRVRILPALAMSITGLSGTLQLSSQGPEQPRFQVQVEAPGGYPADIHGSLTLAFEPDPDLRNAAVADPDRQLSAGPAFDIAAFSLGLPVQLQPGTSAGRITVTAANLNAEGIDITPATPPSASIRVGAAPPVFTACVEERTPLSLRVRMDGVSTTREMRRAVFRFTPAAGASLQTTELVADDVGTRLFDPFYTEHSGYFRFVQSFQVQGEVTAIGALSIVLENSKGASAAVQADAACPAP